jgi:energy-coupling factor transporter ATP-binding protein EcfA2
VLAILRDSLAMSAEPVVLDEARALADRSDTRDIRALILDEARRAELRTTKAAP